MKVTVITEAARSFVDQTAARVEAILRRGHVHVVSILCRDCGRWVKPEDWNPTTAFCEVCTDHQMADARKRLHFTKGRPGFGSWAGAL